MEILREIFWQDNLTGEVVDETSMPYLVDIRAIKAYADGKGVSIVSLTDDEKKKFLIPNPHYRKKGLQNIAAVL